VDRAGEFGLPSLSPTVDFSRVNDHVQSVIAHIQQHDDPERFRSYGCEVLFGQARFTGPRSLEVEGRPSWGVFYL